MTALFASGKRALAICDRCGKSMNYRDLRSQVIDQRPTKILVCDGCLDEDHPQYQLGKVPINDPIALRDARPDTDPGRGLFGWNPIGNPAQCLTASVGVVKVST